MQNYSDDYALSGGHAVGKLTYLAYLDFFVHSLDLHFTFFVLLL